MDPVTAVANAVQAIAVMVTEIVKGQPADVKARIWEQYMKDVEFWRKLLHIDSDADQH